MNLQVDKRYVMRNGQISEPIRPNREGDWPFETSEFYYRLDGRAFKDYESQYDLITEYQEPKKGLTLKEAIESGQPFKRENESIYHRADDFPYFSQDILAEDYSLQPEEEEIVTMTYDQFYNTMNGKISPHETSIGVAIDVRAVWNLAKTLGTVTTRKVKG